MSLALLTLGSLCVRPAQAQSGYPGGGSGGGYPGGGGSPDPGHRWDINYANTNVINKHFVRDVPTAGQITPTDSQGGSTIVDGDEEVTVTATLTWVPAAGKDNTSDPPPDKDHKVHLKEYGRAWERSLGSGPGTGTADDGLGDPMDANGTSEGMHLIQRDGSSGTITLDAVTVKAINPVSTYQSGYPGGGGGSGGYPGGGGYGYWDWTGGESSVGFNVAVDPDGSPRSVTITSSIDPTYQKDKTSGQRAQNVPDGAGTMTADTVLLDESNSGGGISYAGNPTGSWAAGSLYHWYSALMENSSAGTFTMPGDPPINLDVFYLNGNTGTMQSTSQEHINLHCTDASDGASATANYYINWHDEFEGWITTVDVKKYDDIVRISAVYHPSVDDAKFSYDVENKVTVTQKATGEGSLGSDKVGATFGIELGAEFETAVKTTVEFSLVANKFNWVERQAFYHHQEGTVDNYDTHGFVGLLHWTLESAYNPQNPLIDYIDFQRVSDSSPVN